ncbi:MAG: putative ribosome biogenesis GTPase RsgA [Deltaproteobacteria bacterium ADurb.Bin510]|nr:MAG: putative ribosome biogenesis GTPase RsgA [Deltaproteobacteria bacterium ADurb.Bin510]
MLERRTKLSRLAAGSRPGEPGREQVMAANVDMVFLVSSLNQEFNLRRIERYLSAIRAGGAQPVILLTKAELSTEPQRLAGEVAAVAGCPVHHLSVHAGLNLEIFGDYLKPGRTAVLVGSSGVGKSTIVNWLMERQAAATASVRLKDAKGRHTTTYRHLFVLPSGGLLIDTPGIRELRLWEAEAGRSEAFDDIAALARDCRFSDCRHKVEPGCAVRKALTDGSLDEARYLSYLKLGESAERQRHGKR